MTARPPRLERLAKGLYWVTEGEGKGWYVEHMPLEPLVGRQGWGVWITHDGHQAISEALTLSDARGNLPPIDPTRPVRRGIGPLHPERKNRA